MTYTKCSIDGCDRPDFLKSYCPNHYQQMRKAALLGIEFIPSPMRPRKPYVFVKCEVEWCEKPVYTNSGLCVNHFNQRKYDEKCGREFDPRASLSDWIPPTYEECYHDGMGFIPLYDKDGLTDKFAIVDAEDIDLVRFLRWTTSRNKRSATEYAIAGRNQNRVYMHRLILNPPEGLVTDHINHDGLDNRRENLRSVTRRENAQNQPSRKSKYSSYRGVTWNIQSKKWMARTRYMGKTYHLGYFTDEHEAGQVVLEWLKANNPYLNA